jgi:hypothetical protein
MEDILDVYRRPHDPKRPLVCLDETNRQLTLETRPSIATKPTLDAGGVEFYESEDCSNQARTIFFAI